MRYFLCLLILVCGLNESFASKAENKKKTVTILIPGTRYCGPGNLGGKAKSKLDAACKRHDKSKGYTQAGVTKYIPGMGNKDVQKADKRLIIDSAKVIASKKASKKEKVAAVAVGSYFAAKNRVDKATGKTKSKYRKIKKAFKKIFRRKKR